MLLITIFLIGGGKMTKDEIEQQWQKSLKEFLTYHREKVRDMTQEEEKKYVKENKVNEKLQQLQKSFQKMYKDTQK